MGGSGFLLSLGLFFVLVALLGALSVRQIGSLVVVVNRGGQVVCLGLAALFVGLGMYYLLRREARATLELPLPDPNLGPLQCPFCGCAGERACTLCGRFFCAAHGGDRLVSEGAGLGHRIVTRALCDDCTPNQGWLSFQKVLGIVVFVIIILVLLAALMKP